MDTTSVKCEPTTIGEPLTWLGAPAEAGLQLPSATPSASQMYAPRGVFMDDQFLVVADSGNHRVLIWCGVPTDDHQPADVVLGQPDFFTEGPNAAGRGCAAGLHLPTGVWIDSGRLLVADAWNHRVLVWDAIPSQNDTPPSYAIGQPSLIDNRPNRTEQIGQIGLPTASTLYWPYGVSVVDGRLYVADTGNRRVLAWQGIPEPGQPADLVMGQSSPHANSENRGNQAAANSFRWPHAIAGNSDVLYVADAGNHRVLAWAPPSATDVDANGLLGQPGFDATSEFPYDPQGPSRLRFPYAVTVEGSHLVVADTANNRILFWKTLPRHELNPAANAVLGQLDFESNGENRWQAVERDTLCWPYGIHLHNGHLAIADSGNNRVMIWDCQKLL